MLTPWNLNRHELIIDGVGLLYVAVTLVLGKPLVLAMSPVFLCLSTPLFLVFFVFGAAVHLRPFQDRIQRKTLRYYLFALYLVLFLGNTLAAPYTAAYHLLNATPAGKALLTSVSTALGWEIDFLVAAYSVWCAALMMWAITRSFDPLGYFQNEPLGPPIADPVRRKWVLILFPFALCYMQDLYLYGMAGIAHSPLELLVTLLVLGYLPARALILFAPPFRWANIPTALGVLGLYLAGVWRLAHSLV